MKILICLLLLVAPAFAEATPEQVAGSFYAWLRMHPNHASVASQRWAFTPELYAGLQRAADPEGALDFDPWANGQEVATGYSLGAVRVQGNTARIPVKVSTAGGTTRYTCVLRLAGDGWRISNLVYTPRFDLLSTLRRTRH